jgi:undecaprenyl-diphosphatase
MPAQRTRLDLGWWSGLMAAVAALLLFTWLAHEMRAGNTHRFDLEVRSALHSLAQPPLTLAMRILTWLGSIALMGPAGAAAAWLWVRRGRRRAAVLLVVTLAGAIVCDLVLKSAFHRPRPVPFFGLATPASYSFPSGHALISCCFYGLLAGLRERRPRWPGWAGAALLVAVIGFSRVYLGVHYPSDVIAGYAAGAAWTLTASLFVRLLSDKW